MRGCGVEVMAVSATALMRISGRTGLRMIEGLRPVSRPSTVVPAPIGTGPAPTMTGRSTRRTVWAAAAKWFAVSASPAPSADLDVSVMVTQTGDYGATTGNLLPEPGAPTLSRRTELSASFAAYRL